MGLAEAAAGGAVFASVVVGVDSLPLIASTQIQDLVAALRPQEVAQCSFVWLDADLLGVQPGEIAQGDRRRPPLPFEPNPARGLDAFLRNTGVQTVILTGVSVNVGIMGTTIEAVRLIFRPLYFSSSPLLLIPS